MTEQRKLILESSGYLKKISPKNFKPSIALITDINFKLPKYFKVIQKINLAEIPPFISLPEEDPSGKIIFTKIGNKDIIIIHGRIHFYEGYSMRNIGHFIYMLRYLGVKKIIGTDEAGTLNPRYAPGDIALIYDHINLMGDNPLIGENDEELGIRFPDMSDAYSKELFERAYKIFQKHQYKINESVYIGVIGPETETDAESGFYREIGSDVCGYSLVPENITAVHAKMKYLGISLLCRELIADKMREDKSSAAEKNKLKDSYIKSSYDKLEKILKDIIDAV
jgi:purine-nucleoside phosphorylase